MTAWQSVDNDLKLWVWAYREHVRLLDLHDAFWIEQAASGWPNLEELRKALRAYGVMRRKARARFFDDERCMALFRDVCTAAFHPTLPSAGKYAAAQRRCMDAVRWIAKETGTRPDVSLSAAMKVYWFHHPDALPMYDSKGLEGLRRIMIACRKIQDMRQIQPKSAFEWTGRYYESEVVRRVIDAAEFCDRLSPYPNRVIDTYLQLLGLGKAEDIVKRLDCGVWRAPFVA
jgi:hypothetical protein